MSSDPNKFITVKVWRQTKRNLDFIRSLTGQTLAELVDELARAKLDAVKPDIKKSLE